MQVGLSGGIAAGKSEVAAWFKQRGAVILDADRIAHELQDTETQLQQELRSAFGKECFDQAGRVIRAKLGQRVFADPAELKRLNQIIFPYLHRELNVRRALAPSQKLLIVDAALLVEWDIASEFDELWIVAAPDEIRVTRLMQRMALSRAEALSRLRRQLPQEEKLARATHVIQNAGSLMKLQQKLQDFVSHRPDLAALLSDPE